MLNFRATVVDISEIIKFSPFPRQYKPQKKKRKSPHELFGPSEHTDLYLFKSGGFEIFLKNKQN